MTGNLLEVKRFAVHDGQGIRTVLFLKGCPLHCLWCHNPESIDPRPQLAYYEHKCVHCGECVALCPVGAHAMSAGRHIFHRAECRACGNCVAGCLGRALRLYGHRVTIEEALQLALEDRDFFGETGGVTLSGGEPLLQAAFCRTLLTALRGEGVHTAMDTGGAVDWDAFAAVLPVTELFLYDFKHPDSARHRALTGQGNERVLDNLRRLTRTGARIEIRYPLIPGCNDSPSVLRSAAALLSELRVERVKVLPYHALARSKYHALEMPDTMPRADPPDPAPAIEIFQQQGLSAGE